MELIEKLRKLRNYEVQDAENGIFLDRQDQHLIKIIRVEKKLDMQIFKNIQKLLPAECSHIIFIYDKATLHNKNLKNYQKALKIELFEFFELKRLLIGNIFTPSFRLLDEEEKNEVLKIYGENCPSILITDPIVKLYQFNIGEVLEINRGDSLYYRLIVQE